MIKDENKESEMLIDHCSSWSNLSVEQLEDQFSGSRWSKRLSRDAIIVNYCRKANEASEIIKKNIPASYNIAYGSKKRTKMDFFGKDLPADCPILVFVHGGYWQELSKELCYIPALQMHAKGIATVVVGYTLAPEASIKDICDEIKRAICDVCEMARTRNSKGVYLMGWSAGAQLITQVLSTSINEKKELQLIKGFICISGVFELEPLVPTYVNEVLKMDRQTAKELSPLMHVEKLIENFPKIEACVVYGEDESPQFKLQSQIYSESLKKKGIYSLEAAEIPGVDHFNIIENLLEEDFKLTRMIVKMLLK